MVQIRFVDVQIHHAGIRPADLGQVRVPEAAAHLGSPAPILDLGLHLRVAAFTGGDDGMTLAGALQISDHLADSAAGVQLTQPGGGVGVGVVRGFLLLDVHQHDRDIQIPHSRQHVVGSGVGQQLQDHQVHICSAKLYHPPPWTALFWW